MRLMMLFTRQTYCGATCGRLRNDFRSTALRFTPLTTKRSVTIYQTSSAVMVPGSAGAGAAGMGTLVVGIAGAAVGTGGGVAGWLVGIGGGVAAAAAGMGGGVAAGAVGDVEAWLAGADADLSTAVETHLM